MMSRQVRWLSAACVALVLMIQPVMAGDFEQGRAAYQLKDYATAISHFRKAALQGHAAAQASLGLMYTEGHGVPRDDGKAASWYRKAADQGNTDAQFNLGLMYAEGRGVPQDDEKAYMWFDRASGSGGNKVSTPAKPSAPAQTAANSEDKTEAPPQEIPLSSLIDDSVTVSSVPATSTEKVANAPATVAVAPQQLPPSGVTGIELIAPTTPDNNLRPSLSVVKPPLPRRRPKSLARARVKFDAPPEPEPVPEPPFAPANQPASLADSPLPEPQPETVVRTPTGPQRNYNRQTPPLAATPVVPAPSWLPNFVPQQQPDTAAGARTGPQRNYNRQTSSSDETPQVRQKNSLFPEFPSWLQSDSPKRPPPTPTRD